MTRLIYWVQESAENGEAKYTRTREQIMNTDGVNFKVMSDSGVRLSLEVLVLFNPNANGVGASGQRLKSRLCLQRCRTAR